MISPVQLCTCCLSLREFEVIFEDGISLLRILKLFAEDEGEYTCEAVNSVGRASTACYVTVLGE